ncbi:hypothetical protein T02_7126 [Trichinella nativa]|uniref:Uncharacterized protein n=1 Tax=Trichinella nativa TaxID=6335 RepID=A0A0V1LIW3_9BILA|nr:hypothetical protein T02_7126 [Trichinella nativa]
MHLDQIAHTKVVNKHRVDVLATFVVVEANFCNATDNPRTGRFAGYYRHLLVAGGDPSGQQIQAHQYCTNWVQIDPVAITEKGEQNCRRIAYAIVAMVLGQHLRVRILEAVAQDPQHRFHHDGSNHDGDGVDLHTGAAARVDAQIPPLDRSASKPDYQAGCDIDGRIDHAAHNGKRARKHGRNQFHHQQSQIEKQRHLSQTHRRHCAGRFQRFRRIDLVVLQRVDVGSIFLEIMQKLQLATVILTGIAIFALFGGFFQQSGKIQIARRRQRRVFVAAHRWQVEKNMELNCPSK